MVSDAQKPAVARCFVNVLAVEDAKNPTVPQHLNTVSGRNLFYKYYPDLEHEIPGWDLRQVLESYSDQGGDTFPTYFLARRIGTKWEYFAKKDTAEYQEALGYYYRNNRIRPVWDCDAALSSTQNFVRGRPSTGSYSVNDCSVIYIDILSDDSSED